MKSTFVSGILIVCIGFLFSCGGGDSPKAVAEKFMIAMKNYDFETAKKYGTEETGKLLDMMSGFAKMIPDSSREESKIEILKETVGGDNAIVTYKEDGKEAEVPLSLIRVEGKWKVNMTKESINGAEGGNAIDAGATSSDTTENKDSL